MEDIQKAQQQFFQQIKSRLPQHVALVDEVEEVLSISSDSAYRRIRGEKELSFGEMYKLSRHFGISADEALQTATSSEISFRYSPLNPDTFGLKDYIKLAYETVKKLSDAPGREMIYAAKDIPLFHFFHSDELGAFKAFVWQKTLLNFPEFEDRHFSFADADKELLSIGRRLLQLYDRIPSTELWNVETLNSTLRQIEFYAEAKYFTEPSDALLLLDKVDAYIDHLKKEAELGQKFEMDREPDDSSASFKMYNNEIILSDNMVLVMTDDWKITFLTHNAINFLSTSNHYFNDTTYAWFSNLIRKSSLISTVSEKHRNQFFSALKQNVKRSRERVKYLIEE